MNQHYFFFLNFYLNLPRSMEPIYCIENTQYPNNIKCSYSVFKYFEININNYP